MILNMILEGHFKLWVEAYWCFDDLKPFHTRLVLYVINTLFLLILSKILNFLLHKKWAHKFHVIHCLNFKMKRNLGYIGKKFWVYPPISLSNTGIFVPDRGSKRRSFKTVNHKDLLTIKNHENMFYWVQIGSNQTQTIKGERFYVLCKKLQLTFGTFFSENKYKV